MGQFWDTYTPDCVECKSFEKDLASAAARIAELEAKLAVARGAHFEEAASELIAKFGVTNRAARHLELRAEAISRETAKQITHSPRAIRREGEK